METYPKPTTLNPTPYVGVSVEGQTTLTSKVCLTMRPNQRKPWHMLLAMLLELLESWVQVVGASIWARICEIRAL